MATSAFTTTDSIRFDQLSSLRLGASLRNRSSKVFGVKPQHHRQHTLLLWRGRICFKRQNSLSPGSCEELAEVSEVKMGNIKVSTRSVKAERTAYLFAAVASSTGITSLAAASVYYRFLWQMQGSGEVPYVEMLGTFLLAFGAAVGMEYWARWAHKALWHASLWNMHESHHRPREGPFELNDVFAITNALPAIALLAYGFFNKGLFPGLCFGAGLGITVFGIAYMFVHDGLVHRRFPVGPIADVPYFQKVAAAHQLHHADLFEGVPYGLFLGPKELEEVGGSEELERVMNRRKKPQKQEAHTSAKV